MGALRDAIARWREAFATGTDQRRAAILGVGFGLLLCVVIFLACLVILFIARLGSPASAIPFSLIG